MGKGRTWCINFLDDAKSAGDIKVKWKIIEPGGRPRELPGEWAGYTKGMTAREKADRFYNKLKNDPGMSKDINVTRSGNLVCFQLKDDSRYEDIAGIDINSDQTGQTMHVFDDTNEIKPTLETVRFRITGTPKISDGKVRLGVGHLHPRAEVPTHQNGTPLDPISILASLVEQFNSIYDPLGFTCKLEDDEVVIPEVPCEEGASGGTDDVGLESSLSIQDTGLEPFTRIFDKSDVLSYQISAMYSRLLSLEQRVHVVPILRASACDMKISIESPPPPPFVRAGSRTIDVKVKYTAVLNPGPLTGCYINILVEKVSGPNFQVVDRKVTAQSVASQQRDKEETINADINMGLVAGDGLRFTATLVCNECTAAVGGPEIIGVR